jgi:hypothetical protein
MPRLLERTMRVVPQRGHAPWSKFQAVNGSPSAGAGRPGDGFFITKPCERYIKTLGLNYRFGPVDTSGWPESAANYFL